MANYAYGAIKLTGGTSGCLDDLIHTNIEDGDLAFVLDKAADRAYILVWDASSVLDESITVPSIVIIPDSAPATGRWVSTSFQSELITGTAASDTKLYYQLVEKFVTTNTGATITGTLIADGVTIGNSDIFTIGSTGHIFSNGTSTVIGDTANEFHLSAQPNGATLLYHNNVEKITTTATGVTVAGLIGTTTLNIGSTIAITGVLDEDAMGSDSDVSLATQQSIKAYVDAVAGAPSSVGLDVSLADLAVSGLTIEQTVDTNTVGAGGLLLKTDANWDDCNASAEATCDLLLGIAVDAGTGASKTILLQGLYRNDTLYNWTPGAILYALDTVGQLTETAPSDSGDIVRIVGYAISADIIYFDPDKTFLEV